MRHRNYCKSCIPLGTYNQYDLYICNQGLVNLPTLVARYGDRPEQYTTHPVYLSTCVVSLANWIAVAMGLAVSQGYLDIIIPSGQASYSVHGVRVITHV